MSVFRGVPQFVAFLMMGISGVLAFGVRRLWCYCPAEQRFFRLLSVDSKRGTVHITSIPPVSETCVDIVMKHVCSCVGNILRCFPSLQHLLKSTLHVCLVVVVVVVVAFL